MRHSPHSKPGPLWSGSLLRVLAILLLSWGAALELEAQTQTNANVLTYHNDNARTGQNLNETTLTLANVNASKFGRLFTNAVDGWIYSQPLYVEGVTIPGKGRHNVIYVATEHDSVYAFDADSNQGANAAPLWHASFINPAAGLTSVPIGVFGFTYPPELGITGTPVIDPSTSTLYVVAKLQQTSSGSPAKYYEQLYALDLGTGAAKFGSPINITASVTGFGAGAVGGTIALDPLYEFQRAALLLLNGVVYIPFASQGDEGNYHGWVVGYDAQTLQQVGVFNDTPNASKGGIWMSGSGPAADAAGNIYCMSGNGSFDTTSPVLDVGNSFIKLTPQGTNLVLSDYFTPADSTVMNGEDGDLGSGGPTVLPDSVGSAAHPHLMIGCGKDFIIYLVDRDNLGHYNPNNNSQIVQTNTISHGDFSVAAYFNGLFYYLGVNDVLKAFSISNAQMSLSPVSHSADQIGSPGATVSISANDTNNAIAWLIRQDSFVGPGSGAAVLLAYNATNLAQRLYCSTNAGARDALGVPQRFSVPTIANGKVYVPTAFGVAAFGNLGAPFITTQPLSQTINQGDDATFNVGAGGTPPLRFQWQLNGTNIVGATNSWLTVSNAQASASGDYTVSVSNSISNVISAAASLRVIGPPVLSINPQLVLTLQGQVGQTYTIQSTPDLSLGPDGWVTVTVIALTNSIQTYFDSEGSTHTQQFYRAKVGSP